MYTGSLAPLSNQEDWIIQGVLVDDDGADVTLTDATIEFFIARQASPKTAVLSASTATDDGITLPTTTSFQIAFTPADVSGLCAETYNAYLRITIDDVTTQLIAGTIQVLEGGPE